MAFVCNGRFDALIISAEIGYEKPSREIFKAALSMFLSLTSIDWYCFILADSLKVDNEHEKLHFLGSLGCHTLFSGDFTLVYITTQNDRIWRFFILNMHPLRRY